MHKASIRFYENGILSLNLPLGNQVIGARATRSTHPFVLHGFGELFSLLAEKPFRVENPFFWNTKTEVVQTLAEAGCPSFIRYSVSCASTRMQSKTQPHCGVCSQCVDRRFAILSAGLEAYDPQEGYKIDLIIGERKGDHPLTMLSLYVENAQRIENWTPSQFLESFGQWTQVLPYLEGNPTANLMQIHQLYLRHSQQVLKVIEDAIQKHKTAIRQRTLPASCLVRLVTDTSGGDDRNQLERLPSTEPSAFSTSSYIFRRRGAIWEYRYAGGRQLTLHKDKGAEYLHWLLSHPNQTYRATELIGLVQPTSLPISKSFSAELSLQDPSLEQEQMDLTALQECRQRLEEIQEEWEEAKELNNLAMQQQLEEEKQKIMEYLQSTLDVRGQPKKMIDTLEKARKSIRVALSRTITKIAEYDPDFGTYLKSSGDLQTGNELSYRPPESIRWETD